ncbi:MAG: hypothetical protein H8D23_10690, partial [Candidatus Brocadiales bacterium]|nr:hypothetical protein [Candidatus Brocadiales bacterium]
KLNCFDKITSDRQVGFALTSNFFSHLKDGAEMMLKFLYENNEYDLKTFSNFIDYNIDFKVSKNNTSHELEKHMLIDFIESAYPNKIDRTFRTINMHLIYYYINSYDSVVLAAKVASSYFKNKMNKKKASFSLYNLYRAERNHYYDACYLMNYIPKEFFSFFKDNYSINFLNKYEIK